MWRSNSGRSLHRRALPTGRAWGGPKLLQLAAAPLCLLLMRAFGPCLLGRHLRGVHWNGHLWLARPAARRMVPQLIICLLLKARSDTERDAVYYEISPTALRCSSLLQRNSRFGHINNVYDRDYLVYERCRLCLQTFHDSSVICHKALACTVRAARLAKRSPGLYSITQNVYHQTISMTSAVCHRQTLDTRLARLQHAKHRHRRHSFVLDTMTTAQQAPTYALLHASKMHAGHMPGL
jgi:hypothetical protein